MNNIIDKDIPSKWNGSNKRMQKKIIYSFPNLNAYQRQNNSNNSINFNTLNNSMNNFITNPNNIIIDFI